MDIAKILVACLAMVGAVELIPSWGGMLELMTDAIVGVVVYGFSVVALNAAGARKMAGKIKDKILTKVRRARAA